MRGIENKEIRGMLLADMKNCDHIPPRQHEVVGVDIDEYVADCIMAPAHRGPHVTKTPQGKLIAWEYDYDCDCCEPEEDQRCILHWPIEEHEIPYLATKAKEEEERRRNERSAQKGFLTAEPFKMP